MNKRWENFNGITLISMVVTVIILLLLAGIAIATLGGENGIFAKVKQAKKAQLEAEMKEQLTMALQELQIAKQGNATLDDVTQDWANKAILKDYSPLLQEDASLNGKLIIMTKNKIKGKFLIDQNLNIEKIEYNTSSLEFEYTTISRIDNKVKINIVVTDKINGIKQIDYPEGDPLKVVDGNKEQISIDYEVELGKEYKFVITTGDGNKTEKIIKIDDYFYNVTKDLGESAVINNNATKAAYNKTYEATISTEGNYAITSLVVTMGGQTVTTTGGNEVDINTGKIKIEKVTGDINIKVETQKLKIVYIHITVSDQNDPNYNNQSFEANTQEVGKKLYLNIIAKLEGKRCTAVLKEDNSKATPYEVTKNGKYTFIVSGTYNGKTISEEKEVIVNQYFATQYAVKYDAGDWTKEEIEELQGQKLYMINKEKSIGDGTFNVEDSNGLNLTFGGFTYKGDTTNESDISSGNIITNRNQSVAPGNGFGIPKYSGWQLLRVERKRDENKNIIKNEDGTDRIYVKKIMHAGTPENFVYYDKYANNNHNALYILSGGREDIKNNTIFILNKQINARNWQMYIDEKQKDFIADITDADGNIIKDISVMDYVEDVQKACNVGHDYAFNDLAMEETKNLLHIGASYWIKGGIAEFLTEEIFFKYNYGKTEIERSKNMCLGIRPVVTMTEGVYIKSGSGTEEDPYILGKE